MIMDGYLMELSNQLAPSEEFKAHANSVMNDLFRTLQARSKMRIDRIRPEGGVEKKTSLWYSVDYDVTAFVNDKFPPFEDVLNDFQDVILLKFPIKEEEMELKLQPVPTLQFNLRGVDFDLLIATNMVPAAGGFRETTWEIQQKKLLEKIKKSVNREKAVRENSAGLTEAAVEFVKKQSTFVHQVARLAKFWNSTIFFTDKLPGRSSIFELLGIAAAQEEEIVQVNYPPSIVRALRLFLKKVENLYNISVIFTDFYRKSDIPSDILHRKPLLLDPSCPFDDYMERFPNETKDVFINSAKETLRRLEMVERQCQMGRGYPDFKQLFQPQPKPVVEGPRVGFPVPTEWMVGTEQISISQPDVKIRKNSLKSKHILQAIKKMFSAFIHIANMEHKIRPANVSKVEFAKESAKDLISDIFEGKKTNWGPSFKRHDEYDVTFILPVDREGDTVLKISIDWKVI